MEPDDTFHPKANFDLRPWDEQNDTLQSTIGPDHAKRPSDVITVARSLSEFGRLSPKDPAHEGKRTQSLKRFSLDNAVTLLQQDQKAKFTPELKSPSVKMPFDGFTQEDYSLKLVEEYKAAGIPAGDVWAQSFNLDDVLNWIKNKPAFGSRRFIWINATAAA